MKYVALCNHDNIYYSGTLSEIHDEMESDEHDPNDYSFYELNCSITVVYEKKLVIVPTGVKKP